MGNTKVLIETHTNLRPFFFQKLEDFNIIDLDQELLFYSSDVLSRFAFNTDISNDALGIEFLKAQSSENFEGNREKCIKNIGEKSLLLGSYFSASLNRKIINNDYYINLARSAYLSLSKRVTHYLEVENFFEIFARNLELICSMIKKITDDFKKSISNQYVLNLCKNAA